MQLNNFLQINDWEIKKFLEVVLVIQFMMWGVLSLNVLGIQIPILRQLIGFVYLTFVPGIVILRALKIQRLSTTETLLYTVGLSLACLMFMGLAMNMIYPSFGILEPISLTPVIITISGLVLVLSVFSYMRDRGFAEPCFIHSNVVISPSTLFLCLLPFIAILGAYFVNFHHNNILLMILIIILALIPLLIAFDKFIQRDLYPLVVFIITISLLYHKSLISLYLWGWDIHFEYILADLVKQNLLWDSTLPYGTNAMLAIVMLPPIFSDVCGMSLTWVFKLFYPFIFSLVPLGLYHVFQKQIGDKLAFLACFFFVSEFTFYGEMLSLARQEIAELFLVLMLLLMIDRQLNKLKKSLLFIVFGLSIVVSHYGISYFYLAFLVCTWVILLIRNSLILNNNFYAKLSIFGKEKRDFAEDQNTVKIEDRTISSTFVLLFAIFTLAWYIYVSKASAFEAIVDIGNHISRTIFLDFLNPETVQGLDILLIETATPLHTLTKYLHLATQFFIFLGILTVLLIKDKGIKLDREFEIFSVLGFTVCLASITVPYFACSLNTTRLYHITLIFLAPLCLIGGIMLFRIVGRVAKKSWTDHHVRTLFILLSVFFGIFLLLNSGFVYEVAKDQPTSIALSQRLIKEHGTIRDINTFYSGNGLFLEQDIVGIIWLTTNQDKGSKISADYYHQTLLLVSYGRTLYEYRSELENPPKVEEGSYIFLGYQNVKYGILNGPHSSGQYWSLTELSPLIDKMSLIYTNGGAQTYYR